jgi:alpha-beta hydrolase superfamily lysophospholipase
MTDAREWVPDVLGAGFEQLTLHLEPDAEGPVDATLVRYTRRPRFASGAALGATVLYVHGWSDYFFQRHVAEYWRNSGARFFALDLRKYGRSLRPGQTPGYVTDLATYDEDLAAALDVIGDFRKIILVGHSTGGLTLSLWAARNPGRVSALVLNSPWLEFQAHELGRAALAPAIALQARYRPLDHLPTVDLGFYTRSVSDRFDGEWDYDFVWRPRNGFAVHPAWLSAVLAGHARVALGLDIDAPVLTLLSTRSTLLPRWSPDMLETDTALDVDIVAQRTVKLGNTVSLVRLPGALHDVTLSKAPVRARAAAETTRWLTGYLR